MSTRLGRQLLIAGAFLLAPPVSAQQDAGTAPPRTITDVTELLGRYKADNTALTAARAVLERTPPQSASEEELARYYLQRGAAAARLGNQPERLRAVRAAGALSSLTGNLSRRVLNEWANAEESSGNWQESIRLRELSRSRFQDETGARMADNGSLGDTYASQGDFAAANRLLAESEEIFRTMTVSDWFTENRITLLERQRGDAYWRQGRYSAAEAAYRKALVSAQKDIEINRRRIAAGVDTMSEDVVFGMRQTRARKLALTLIELGRAAEAEYIARDILKFSLEWSGRAHPETGRALALLSDILLSQGRYHDAEVLARASLTAFEESGISGTSSPLAFARGHVAGALVAQERWQDALAMFEQRQDAARTGDSDNINLAIALYHTGKFERAAAIFERRYRYWRLNFSDSHPQAASMRAFGALARAGDGTGDVAAALKDLSEAMPVLIDRMRDGHTESNGRFVRALRFKWIADGYLRLLSGLYQRGQVPAGMDAVSDAFRVADAARGSRVQVALSASAARAAIRDPALAALARDAQDTSQRIAALTEILVELLGRPASQQLPKVVAKLRSDLGELEKRRRELRAEIDKRFPEYASLVNPKAVSIEEAQKALRPGESLIAFFCTRERSYVWAVTNSGAPAFAVAELGAAERAAAVHKLRQALDGEPGQLLREIPEFDVSLAHRLYSRLLAPVEAGWRGASSLIVVPHGGLGQIPFALLPTGPASSGHAPEKFEGYRQVPWLLRKASLTQLPSVTSLVTQRAAPLVRPPSRTFAGFGDPVFTAGAQTAIAQVTGGLQTRNVFKVPQGSGKAADSIRIDVLPALPDTRLEVREIAAALQAEEARDVFLGVQASERRVRTADLSDRRVVLFATHGLIPGDLDGLTQPALALSNPKLTNDPDDDGLLTVEEIVGLRLNADLVVLSACNTAAGDGDGAEAVSGLGRAFFYAGARAVLVSNWPVESVSARLLTTQLFSRLVKDPGLAPTEALRLAMLSLLDAGTGKAGDTNFAYAHPTFWAPFTLVGEGRAR